MSLEWTAKQLCTPLSHLVEEPKFNPRPRGIIRPGSAAEAILRLMQGSPNRWYLRNQLIFMTGRTRKAVDWGVEYLQALQLIELDRLPYFEPGGNQRMPQQRFRLYVANRSNRGRPLVPTGHRRAKLNVRVREDIAHSIVAQVKRQGPEWLDRVLERALGGQVMRSGFIGGNKS